LKKKKKREILEIQFVKDGQKVSLIHCTDMHYYLHPATPLRVIKAP